MPETDDADNADRVKQLAVTLVDAYVRKDRDGLEGAVAGIGDDAAEVTSDLKVFATFLTRRVQETGVVWKPADAREAVAAAVADMLAPEIEFAVVTVWEAYSLGEEEAAERFTNGDPVIYVHMLAAFCAAIGQAVYKPAELISTLRIACGLAE
ncbi:hypothetical protein CDO52_10125 [Nocardiopsis gilva YIM 90087]|uniref:Uncharacterized protein n=1 Tax=Nocardiopsis gilva YIM 90087 TaxID=1235441 RepID=A0A223S4Q4_9ACTN|nr:hypothetical protein [Nocardiopsis gilva]ASU83088.1 hypothetical protein CDO52_10125 [Nocardiopsis gilva YIM 90087]